MGGRRIEKRAPRRNPLFKIFVALCIAVLALAVTAVMLGIRLSTVSKELALAQSRLEQYADEGILPDAAQDDHQEDGCIPGDDTVATEPTVSEPEGQSETKPDPTPETKTETEKKIGWLDLTGHKEVQAAPKSVFDKYYTYYTTNGVNLRGGPGTGYDRITLIELGTEVKAAAKDGDWTFVTVDGKFGWISSGYLSTSKPEPVAQTQEDEVTSRQAENPSSTEESVPSELTEEIEEIPDWLAPQEEWPTEKSTL